jgi:hypothetical protein
MHASDIESARKAAREDMGVEPSKEEAASVAQAESTATQEVAQPSVQEETSAVAEQAPVAEKTLADAVVERVESRETAAITKKAEQATKEIASMESEIAKSDAEIAPKVSTLQQMIQEKAAKGEDYSKLETLMNDLNADRAKRVEAVAARKAAAQSEIASAET